MKRWTSPLVATTAPIVGDMFVVITVEGQRVFAGPVSQFQFAVEKAHEFAAKTKQPIKVSCLSFLAMLRFLGMTPAQYVNGMSPAVASELRHLAIKTCFETISRAKSADMRKDAEEVLSLLGYIKTR